MNIPVTSGPAGRPPSPPSTARCRRRWCQLTVVVTITATLLLMLAAGPAWSAPAHRILTAAAPPAPTLDSVINGLRTWLIGLLAAVATLFLTIGGIRYITAGGDPVQVERAKTALKSAAIGYALAALSPLLVEILRSVVG